VQGVFDSCFEVTQFPARLVILQNWLQLGSRNEVAVHMLGCISDAHCLDMIYCSSNLQLRICERLHTPAAQNSFGKRISAAAGTYSHAGNVTDVTVHGNDRSLHGDSLCGPLWSVSAAYTQCIDHTHTRHTAMSF
jgi:hypothetical protein